MSNITYRRSDDPDGPRHCLDGTPIHCGQPLDVLTELGWLTGRFEIAHTADRTGGQLVEDSKVPMFHASLPIMMARDYATGSVSETMCFQITERHVFRWPARGKPERRAQLTEAMPTLEVWGECAECGNPARPEASVCADCATAHHSRGPQV